MSRPSIQRTGFQALLLAAAMVFFSLSSLSPAQAQWVSTGELVDRFCDSEEPEQAAFCVGYIAGSLHVLMAPPELFPTGRFCMDLEQQPKLTAIAERLVAVRKEQEEIATTPAYTVIAAILERGFPCPEEMLDATEGNTPPAPPQPAGPPEEVFGLED